MSTQAYGPAVLFESIFGVVMLVARLPLSDRLQRRIPRIPNTIYRCFDLSPARDFVRLGGSWLVHNEMKTLGRAGDQVIEITSLGVLPEYRHRGYGKAMMDTIHWYGRQEEALLFANVECKAAGALELCKSTGGQVLEKFKVPAHLERGEPLDPENVEDEEVAIVMWK